MLKQDIEKIPTGLTKNYVSYWTEKQAIREAMQNIAYGVVKSGKGFKAEWKLGIGTIEDYHTGFDKSMLYIGESEQRNDEEGLGNFGEGWKVFLLVMARNGREHRVDTVGFSFYGKMEPTIHGVETLNIYIEPNNRKVGTKVTIECYEDDFYSAMESFGVLAGIDRDLFKGDRIIPNRKNELWINGVRIENEQTTNPLDLYYAYNIELRTAMNRDRSQVDINSCMDSIQNIWGSMEDEKAILEYITLAMHGEDYMDIQKGPSIIWSKNELWRKLLAEKHGTKFEKLVIPSSNPDINKEAEYRGYTPAVLPQGWYSELRWLGMKSAEDVINKEPRVKEVELDITEKQMLRRAKLNVKKCLGLASVKELPKIVPVEGIHLGAEGTVASGAYHRKTKTIYLSKEAFKEESYLTRVLLHEAVHWYSGFDDTDINFTRIFERIVIKLLGYEITP